MPSLYFSGGWDEIDHYSGYFMTMKYTNAEFTETAHSTFKMYERIPKFKVTRKNGTPVHKELSSQNVVDLFFFTSIFR